MPFRLLTPLLIHVRHNLVGYLALVVALGGTSYAAVGLTAGQVKTKHLANNAVTSVKVKDGAITRADLKRGVVNPDAVLLASTLNSAGTAGTPPAHPDHGPTGGTSFAMTRSGNVLVQASLPDVAVACASGSGSVGLYVDNKPVAHTSVNVPGTLTPRSLMIVGSASLKKGQHQIGAGADCSSGSPLSVQLARPIAWTVLLVD